MTRPKQATRLLVKMLPFGITQTNLAEAMGVSVDYVNMCFCGRYTPKGNFFEKCETALENIVKERCL